MFCCAIRTVWDEPTPATSESALDDLDMRIVAALQRNGRITNIEMARSLGVSEATIRNRMGRLLDEDLINIVGSPPRGRWG